MAQETQYFLNLWFCSMTLWIWTSSFYQ